MALGIASAGVAEIQRRCDAKAASENARFADRRSAKSSLRSLPQVARELGLLERRVLGI